MADKQQRSAICSEMPETQRVLTAPLRRPPPVIRSTALRKPPKIVHSRLCPPPQPQVEPEPEPEAQHWPARVNGGCLVSAVRAAAVGLSEAAVCESVGEGGVDLWAGQLQLVLRSLDLRARERAKVARCLHLCLEAAIGLRLVIRERSTLSVAGAAARGADAPVSASRRLAVWLEHLISCTRLLAAHSGAPLSSKDSGAFPC